LPQTIPQQIIEPPPFREVTGVHGATVRHAHSEPPLIIGGVLRGIPWGLVNYHRPELQDRATIGTMAPGVLADDA
jgi:hypothetical protein